MKFKKSILLLIALISISIIYHQESYADTLEETPATTNQVNLVPDAEVAKQLNLWGNFLIPNWPTYIEITQEKFDLINQFEGNNNVVILLQNVPAKSLEGLQYIQSKKEVWVAIAGTEITDLTPLTQIGNLTHLELVESDISSSNLEVIRQLTQLNYLTLSTNTDLDLNLIADMPNLIYVALQGISRRIELLPPTASFNLPKMEMFSILYANISDVSFIGTQMSALKQLMLVSLPITNVDALIQLPHLEMLFLFDTFVSSYPAELTTLIQNGTGTGGMQNENNWYEGDLQNKLAPIETKEMMKNEVLQIDIPLAIQNTSPFIAAMEQQGMTLLTSSDLFQAEITSSNPAIVSVDQTSTVHQLSLSSHNRSGTAVITYKLPSNTEVSFEVTVHGDGIPPVVQGDNVVYEQGVAKTKEDYLKDAKIVLDKEGMITTDFEQVVNLNQAGDYTVNVYATDEDGVQSATLQLKVTVEAKKVVEPSVPTLPVIENLDQEEISKQETKEQANNEALPATANKEESSLIVLGSLFILTGIAFIRKKRFSVR